ERSVPVRSTRAVLLSSFSCGVAIAAGTLVRPGWLPWCLPAVVLLMWATRRTSVALKGGNRAVLLVSLLAFLIGFVAVMSPWVIRNRQVSGHWVLTSLWSGPSLYDGLNAQATGASDMTFIDEEKRFEQLSEFEANRWYSEQAVAFARQNPGRSLELAMIKAARFLSLTPNADSFSNQFVNLACLVFYLPFFAMAVWGLWVTRGNFFLILILAGPLVQFLLVHMVFVGSIRYRLPVEFPLSILAARGVLAILQRVRVDRQSLTMS
ncbi:MAG: hypothetical protein KDA96_13935, partial [Planctomycetaceae bacterium]|nr:hypothetical protein [Planctomycetaceae bacterium]